ncbi:MAG: hypothetical protein QM731_02015 [Chitinophagaceae bacterium]
MNTVTIIIVVIAAIALLVFMNLKNKKDRKKLFKPGSTDPVEVGKTEQDRRKDQL